LWYGYLLRKILGIVVDLYPPPLGLDMLEILLIWADILQTAIGVIYHSWIFSVMILDFAIGHDVSARIDEAGNIECRTFS
jgi:hypothetical protein